MHLQDTVPDSDQGTPDLVRAEAQLADAARRCVVWMNDHPSAHDDPRLPAELHEDLQSSIGAYAHALRAANVTPESALVYIKRVLTAAGFQLGLSRLVNQQAILWAIEAYYTLPKLAVNPGIAQ
ncbi:MAG TPA: hypothetical protein VKH19_15635 [Gemmatimonadaceae bacterium]|nr:hypothetical protein [Gemmatimonadaceae bacterium]